ncbi:AmmeMemoRadiSam system radical SAM enzyme [Candidatus Woesearchaeota archaeon]|nr:AmmeMemoRadiSam system radical SAM enzyme [Candidatus Woesearchaeota archaeon]
MKQALFWIKKKDKTVQCHLCPRNCIIKDKERGNCRVRENKGGKLYSLVYGEACAVAIDPIEKKPLFHFLPGSTAYSIGTAGCNLHCKFCQNWTTSQANPEDVYTDKLPPSEIVKNAVESGCKSIAYTYNEPIVYYEYVLDTAKLAKKKGVKNVIVCNGFINQEPLLELCKYIDAANIDLKGFTDKYYKEITGAWLQPVLDTIKTLYEKGVWVELTTLLIPTLNDDPETIKKMCRWIKDNIGPDVPLHFSAFYPCYLMKNLPATPPETVLRAREIALEEGINYVYAGNIKVENEGNTACPKCGEVLITRNWFSVDENKVKNSKCSCGHKIPGVWE